jgi:hypothetical protein
MFFRECPFCHKHIFVLLYPFHIMKHTALRSDGQMHDHITLREDKRYAGSLDDVPQTYYHPKCGVLTCMPEEIIRSYLVNPNMYNATSFCCGCNCYIPTTELYWCETDECLEDYFQNLRKSLIQE